MRRTEIVPVRFTKEELEHLKECAATSRMAAFQNGRKNFSGFLRDSLLAATGKKNKAMELSMSDLCYEIRKIGVNINQVTKKINGGFGTKKDLEHISRQMGEVQSLLHACQKEMEELWRSQN